MRDIILKQKLNSLYGVCAAGEYPAPRFTNNSRKMAELPMFRKGKARCRKYRGFRNPGAEALQALVEAWNAGYIDTDSVSQERSEAWQK